MFRTWARFTHGHVLLSTALRQRQGSGTQVTAKRRWPRVPGAAPHRPGTTTPGTRGHLGPDARPQRADWPRPAGPARSPAQVPGTASRRAAELGARGSERHGAPDCGRLLPGRRGYARGAADGSGAGLWYRGRGAGVLAKERGRPEPTLGAEEVLLMTFAPRSVTRLAESQGRFGGSRLEGHVLEGAGSGDPMHLRRGFCVPLLVLG